MKGSALKRTQPLARSTAARKRKPREPVAIVCAVCGTDFVYRPTGGLLVKTCSRSCAATLKRRNTPDRRGRSNPNYRHGKRAGERDRAKEPGWYAAMAKTCQHPDCPGERGILAQHHLVYAQAVRRAGGDLFDPRNGLTLCTGCHLSHHNRGSYVIPLAVVPDAAFAFAAELLGSGVAYNYLHRRYSGEDPRLDDLLRVADCKRPGENALSAGPLYPARCVDA